MFIDFTDTPPDNKKPTNLEKKLNESDRWTPHISIVNGQSISNAINWNCQQMCKWKKTSHIWNASNERKIIGDSVLVCALGLSFGAAQIELKWIETLSQSNRPSAFHMISKLIPILLRLNFTFMYVIAVRFASLFFELIADVFLFYNCCCWCAGAAFVVFVGLVCLSSRFLFYTIFSYSIVLAAISLKHNEMKNK